MDAPVLANQQGLTYIGSVRTLDTVLKTHLEWWMIGMDGENSVLSAWRDDVDLWFKRKKNILYKVIKIYLFIERNIDK